VAAHSLGFDHTHWMYWRKVSLLYHLHMHSHSSTWYFRGLFSVPSSFWYQMKSHAHRFYYSTFLLNFFSFKNILSWHLVGLSYFFPLTNCLPGWQAIPATQTVMPKLPLPLNIILH
jgi:hypothetical protein